MSRLPNARRDRGTWMFVFLVLGDRSRERTSRVWRRMRPTGPVHPPEQRRKMSASAVPTSDALGTRAREMAGIVVRLTLWQHAKGHAKWTLVRYANTSRAGWASIAARLKHGTAHRWTFDGNPQHAATSGTGVAWGGDLARSLDRHGYLSHGGLPHHMRRSPAPSKADSDRLRCTGVHRPDTRKPPLYAGIS